MSIVRLVERIGRPARTAILAVVMLLIAAGAVFVVLHDGSSPAYIGHRWKLVKLVHNGEDLPLPEGERASVSYLSSNQFTLDDTVNSSGGKFTSTGSGYVTSDVGVTLKAYIGTDQHALALFAAMDTLAAGAERAEVRQEQLILHVKGYVFTFDDAGPATLRP